MPLTRSPGVRGETALNGPTPLDMRRALEALAGGPYPGVISGCTVTGTASWEYQVAAGLLATQRTTTDGLNLWSNTDAHLITQADDTTSLTAPGSGSRVDIIYALHHDIDQGDADSLPVITVRKGTPSGGTPTPPTLPDGAIEIARKTVAAGDTSTSVGAAISHADQAIAGDSGWVTLTLAGGLSHATNNTVRYKLGRDGYVQWEGRVEGTFSGPGTTTINATPLPEAVRPAQTKRVTAQSSGLSSTGRVEVAVGSGNVIIGYPDGAGTYYDLSGLGYYTR